MQQMSLAQPAEFQRFARKTRRELFLSEMDQDAVGRVICAG
jgi:hypothetical protein